MDYPLIEDLQKESYLKARPIPKEQLGFPDIPACPINASPTPKPDKCKVLKTHDDGDQTLKCKSGLFVLTTDGKLFKEANLNEITSYRGQTDVPFDPNIVTSHMGGLIFSTDNPKLAEKYAQGQRANITKLKVTPNNMLDLGEKVMDGSQEVNISIRKALKEPDGPGFEILSLLKKHGHDSVTFIERAGWDIRPGRTYAYIPELMKGYVNSEIANLANGQHLENKEANETGFTICLQGKKLIQGCRGEGTPEHLSLDICCPPGAKAVGTFHVHTNDVLEPSRLDIDETKRLGLKYLCVGDTKGRVRCKSMKAG